MRRRWLLLAELAFVLGLAAWAGALYAQRRAERPEGAIDVKVRLHGADDRAYLVAVPSGGYLYEVRFDDGTRVALTPDEFAERLHGDESSRSWLAVLFNVSSPLGFTWVALGLIGQLLFTGRMIVQWLASERASRSVVPIAFWWMSLVGSTMLLAYFLWRKDAVGVLGQSVGWFVYVRNLWLIRDEGREGIREA
jgi:lipid-A-disaccharide synthase-like uncharacterized protein